MKKKCAICNKESNRAGMIKDSYYDDVSYHIGCMNSQKGIAWRSERANSDKLYARYLDLISHGKGIRCPNCNRPQSIYLKSVDRPELWETTCDVCGSVDLNGVSAYQSEDMRDVVSELKMLQQKFLRAGDASINKRIEAISYRCGPLRKCGCGGVFLLAAYPRCSECCAILMDSYVHYSQSN